MAHSKFDVEYGLSRPAAYARLPVPHNIISLESESEAHDGHEDPAPVTLPDLLAAVTAEPSNVRQHTRQENQADLESVLAAFQKEESEKFPRRESVASHRDFELSNEDYIDSDQDQSEDDSVDQDSDDEGMELDPRPAGEPNPRIPPERNVQTRCDQHCSVAEKPLKLSIQVDSEKVEEVQYCDFLSGAENTESGEDERPVDAEESVPTRDHPASPAERPPMEEKYTKELSKQIDPFSDSGASVSLTPAASPSAALQLPSSKSDLTVKICESNLEIISVTFTVAAAQPAPIGSSVSEGSVKKAAAADGSNVLEGESVKDGRPAA